MAIDWTDIRYRGDANDVEELLTTYRVADYLATYEENRRQIDQGIRERLLKEGIRLSERLSPRIYRVYSDVTAALGLETQAEVFCLPSTEINAFAILDVRKDTTYSLVGVTAPALERLDDAELRSILEHNRDEEKEHAAMALEWLRRNDPKMDEHLRTFLFKEGPITQIEANMMKASGSEAGDDAGADAQADGSLGIGSLRKTSDQVKK